MAPTYNLISSNILSSSAASVTFSSIPGTFTDLLLKMSVRNDDTTNIVGIRFNSDSASGNYGSTILRGSGGAASTLRYTTNRTQVFHQDGAVPSGADADTFSNSEIYIPSYTVSQNKPMFGFTASEDASTTAYLSAAAHLWKGTAAITSINIYSHSGNLVSGSSFYLYGISNA